MKTVKKPETLGRPILAFSQPDPREAGVYYENEIRALWEALCDVLGLAHDMGAVAYTDNVIGKYEALVRQVVADGRTIAGLRDQVHNAQAQHQDAVALTRTLQQQIDSLRQLSYGCTHEDPFGQRSYRDKYEALSLSYATAIDDATARVREQLQAQSQELANLREQVRAQASVIDNQRRVIADQLAALGH